MAPLKQALTFEQQVEHLKIAHGLEIKNASEAIDILKRVNYYRLSAYGIGLKQNNNSEYYKSGVSLSDLYRLYQFDSHCRNQLMHIIEQIEIQFRTTLAYHIAIKYGPEGYMDSNNFKVKAKKDGTDIHTSILESFRTECLRQQNLPFVKHHKAKYDGHFPIWVATELFTFGNLSSLYDIMLPDDQKTIAQQYSTDAKYLRSWVLSLVEVRNICAHYTRLYNLPLKQTPFLYTEHVQYRNKKINKLFPIFLVIKRMTKNTPELWEMFLEEFKKLMDEYADVVKLSFIGFPQNWYEVLN